MTIDRQFSGMLQCGMGRDSKVENHSSETLIIDVPVSIVTKWKGDESEDNNTAQLNLR